MTEVDAGFEQRLHLDRCRHGVFLCKPPFRPPAADAPLRRHGDHRAGCGVERRSITSVSVSVSGFREGCGLSDGSSRTRFGRRWRCARPACARTGGCRCRRCWRRSTGSRSARAAARRGSRLRRIADGPGGRPACRYVLYGGSIGRSSGDQVAPVVVGAAAWAVARRDRVLDRRVGLQRHVCGQTIQVHAGDRRPLARHLGFALDDRGQRDHLLRRRASFLTGRGPPSPTR